MNTQEQEINLDTITCHTCSKITSRKNAFSIYSYYCCSIKCLEPLRKQRQDEQRKIQEERDSKHSHHGAFTLGGGGFI